MKRAIRAGYNLDPTGEIGKAWEILIDNGVSEETLSVITSINGNSLRTLNDVARAVFGVDLEDLEYPWSEDTLYTMLEDNSRYLED